MKIILSFMILCLVFMDATAQSVQSRVPLSVDAVKTYHSNGRLIRIIEYLPNKKLPFMDIEVVEIPGREKLLSRLSIDKVQVNLFGKKTTLDFHKAQGVGFENISVSNGKVKFKFEFINATPPIFRVFVACEVDARLEQLPQPLCKEIQAEDK